MELFFVIALHQKQLIYKRKSGNKAFVKKLELKKIFFFSIQSDIGMKLFLVLTDIKFNQFLEENPETKHLEKNSKLKKIFYSDIYLFIIY